MASNHFNIRAESSHKAINNPLNWTLYVLYAVVLCVSVSRHELWGDELHSWNLSRSADSILSLFNLIRYEGHPPLWYMLLFFLSRFTTVPESIQFLHVIVVLIAVYQFVFYCPFPVIVKFLILSGYYFSYEYTVLSRNYSLIILFGFLYARNMQSQNERNMLIRYVILFFLCLTHVLGLLLAISLQIVFMGGHTSKKNLGLHFILSCLLFFSALYFVFPPQSSSLNLDFWFRIWSKDQLYIIVQAPLKAFVPVSAWWEHNLWNTQFIIELQKSNFIFKILNPLISCLLLVVAIFILRGNKKGLYFFIVNLTLTCLFALVFPLTSFRYVGIIFVSFIVALWLFPPDRQLSSFKISFFYFLLVIQLVGACVMLARDWRQPFAQGATICKLTTKNVTNSLLVTDYWCLNYATAYLEKPVYCLGFKKPIAYLQWDSAMSKILASDFSFFSEIDSLLHINNDVTLVTNLSLAELYKKDPKIKVLNVQDTFSAGNAIEKNSNIFVFTFNRRSTLSFP